MKLPIGKYCEVYGATLQNRVLEFFLEADRADIAVSEIVLLSRISKPKIYQIIEDFVGRRIVVRTRIVGKTQFYALDKGNILVKIYLRNFKECLSLGISNSSNGRRAGVKAAINNAT